MKALDQLTEEQRTALVLVDMEGYSVEEVAEMVGCAPGTVKSRCARGRAKLAPLLAQYRRNQEGNNHVQEEGSTAKGHAESPDEPSAPARSTRESGNQQ